MFTVDVKQQINKSWIKVGQGPTALAVGADRGCLAFFTLVYHFSFPSPLFGLVGWLFWVKRPFETVFQFISGRLPKRGKKRREKDR